MADMADEEEPRRDASFGATWTDPPMESPMESESASQEENQIVGTNATFEELLARELAKMTPPTDATDAQDQPLSAPIPSVTSTQPNSTKPKPKTFLKKGSRGWWTKLPQAKERRVKHSLSSKELEPTLTASSSLPTGRPGGSSPSPWQGQTEHQVSANSTASHGRTTSSSTLSSRYAPPDQLPIQASDGSPERIDRAHQKNTRKDPIGALSASLERWNPRMSGIFREFEAQKQKEQEELSAFEQLEKQLMQSNNEIPTQHRKPSGKVLHQQEEEKGLMEVSTNWPGKPMSLEEFQRDFDQNWNGFQDFEQLQQQPAQVIEEPPAYLNRHTEAPSEPDDVLLESSSAQIPVPTTSSSNALRHSFAGSDLSAISLNDSEPWDDMPNDEVKQHAGDFSDVDASELPNGDDGQRPRMPWEDNQRFDNSNNDAEEELPQESRNRLQGEPPTSTIVQRLFMAQKDNDHSKGNPAPPSSEMIPDQRRSTSPQPRDHVVSAPQSVTALRTLKQKLQRKPPTMTPKASLATAGATRAKSRQQQAPQRGVVRRKQVSSRNNSSPVGGAKSSPSSDPSSSLAQKKTTLPVVIEEKLFELEEEVKFYKAETLKLHKAKQHFEDESAKLEQAKRSFEVQQEQARKQLEISRLQQQKQLQKQRLQMEKTFVFHQNKNKQDKKQVEALKAQLVALEMDQKKQKTKWKTTNDALRRRIAELEQTNQELTQEIQFLETQRVNQLKQQQQQETLLPKPHEKSPLSLKSTPKPQLAPNRMGSGLKPPNKSGTGLPWNKLTKKAEPAPIRSPQRNAEENETDRGSSWGDTHSPSALSASSSITTLGDLRVTSQVAQELNATRNQSLFTKDNSKDNSSYANQLAPQQGNQQDEDDQPPQQPVICAQGSGWRVEQCFQPKKYPSDDGYNPKRYESTLDWINSPVMDDQTNASPKPSLVSNESGGASSETRYPLPREDNQLTQLLDEHSKGRLVGEKSQLTNERRLVDEIVHPRGKTERIFSDGSKEILFKDGTRKQLDADGHFIIHFVNGDTKEFFPDTQKNVYFYAEAQTKLTTLADNTRIYEFASQQVEKNFPDGRTEILYPDGTHKTNLPDGTEVLVFPDGVRMVDTPDGVREMYFHNNKSIRYYPDGHMGWVVDGQETQVESKELEKILERENA